MTSTLKKIIKSDKAGGFLLLFATLLSLVLANSSWGPSYINLWHSKVLGLTLEHWINDGLMAIFFLLIGLELEREIYVGELSSKKKAILPIFAAIGGMIVPAGIFFILNMGLKSQAGTGIPMATDIAFALAILSLLGKRVPVMIKIFLTALAVIDDLGAILIISLFYSSSISLLYLSLSALLVILLLLLNKLKVYSLWPYLLGGVLLWMCMFNSGVHATITGVILAFLIPFRKIKDYSPSKHLLDFLHSPVTFVILPLFALANTAISFSTGTYSILSPLNLGIFLGLALGKPLGIWLFSYLPHKLEIAKLPQSLNLKHLWGLGMLGGIGFTMSIFISLLAFDDQAFINNSKVSILLASLVSGAFGYLYLNTIEKSKNR